MSCSKVKYESHKEAAIVLRVIKQSRNKRPCIPKRVYYCKICKGFHLTSQNRKEKKVMKDKPKGKFRYNE